MTNINPAYKAKVDAASSNRNWLSEYTAKGGSDIESLTKDAYATNKATQDNVNYSTDDSSGSSGSNTIQNIATIGTLLISAATSGISIYQALTGKGTGSGSSGGSSSAAGGGDPLAALNSATSAYQANSSKANLKSLTQAISTATTVRNSMQEAVNKLLGDKETYVNMLQGNEATYEKCKNHLDGLQNEMAKQGNIITEQNAKISENEEIIQACEQGNAERVLALSKNKQAQATQEGVVTQAKENVTTAEGAVDKQTTAQAKAEEEQKTYVNAYSQAKANESGLKTTWDNATANLKTATDDFNSAKSEIEGLKAQISADKSNKKDVSSLEAKLNAAKTKKNNAEEALKKAETAERDAKKAYDANQKEQAELEGKIQIGDKTLAQIKADLVVAQQTKSEAETKFNTAGNELRGFIDEGAIIDKEIQANAQQLSDSKARDSMLNTALAAAINGKNELVEQNFNAKEATVTVKNNIAKIEDALGNTNDESTLMGKLNQYNVAIAKAEAARDGKYSVDEFMTGGELYEKANKYGIELPNGAANLVETPNGCTVVMKDGSKIDYDKNGNRITTPSTTTPAGTPPATSGTSAPSTVTPPPTGAGDEQPFAALTQKDGKPEPPTGFSGTVPDGATQYRKDGDNFIFIVGNEAIECDNTGKVLKKETVPEG